MRRRIWRGLAATMVLAVAFSVALSGCATLVGTTVLRNLVQAEHHTKVPANPNSTPNPHAAVGEPAVGSCWVATVKYADYANWGNRAAVDCSAPHQLYTFAVLQLRHPHTGDLFTKSGYVVNAVWNDAQETCGDRSDDQFADIDPEGRVYFETYVPEKKEWAAGARWVRCDFGVFAVGSSYAHPAFENLPDYATFRKLADKTPNAFGDCTNDPKGDSPVGPGAVYADCTANPQWTLYDDEIIPEPTNDAYPTAAQLNTAYVLSCKDPWSNGTHVTFPVYPSKSDWNDGDETLQCWIGRK